MQHPVHARRRPELKVPLCLPATCSRNAIGAANAEAGVEAEVEICGTDGDGTAAHSDGSQDNSDILTPAALSYPK